MLAIALGAVVALGAAVAADAVWTHGDEVRTFGCGAMCVRTSRSTRFPNGRQRLSVCCLRHDVGLQHQENQTTLVSVGKVYRVACVVSSTMAVYCTTLTVFSSLAPADEALTMNLTWSSSTTHWFCFSFQ